MHSCYFRKIKVENVIFGLISAIYFENHVQIYPIQSVKIVKYDQQNPSKLIATSTRWFFQWIYQILRFNDNVYKVLFNTIQNYVIDINFNDYHNNKLCCLMNDLICSWLELITEIWFRNSHATSSVFLNCFVDVSNQQNLTLHWFNLLQFILNNGAISWFIFL